VEDKLPAGANTSKTATLDGPDLTDPLLTGTTPLPRYNTRAMLAVLRNTLYIRVPCTSIGEISLFEGEDIQSTPLPGDISDVLRLSRKYWTQKAHNNSDKRGKQLVVTHRWVYSC